MLYEVALIEEPSKKDLEDGAVEKLLLKPTPVIAKDENGAAVKAVHEFLEKDTNLDKVKVLVRPFG